MAGNDGRYAPGYHEVLRPLEREDPPRLFYTDGDNLHVALSVPAGQERDDVVNQVVAQVKELALLIQRWDALHASQLTRADATIRA